MSAQHTPGPWVIIPERPYDGDEEEFQGGYVSPAGIEGDDGSPVCTFGSSEGSGTLFENEADRRLIAAAPDLLEALIAAKQEMWLSARHRWTQADFKNWAIIQKIDAALEKADGKPRTPQGCAAYEAAIAKAGAA